jgi:CheY-like chemotaxis protein
MTLIACSFLNQGRIMEPDFVTPGGRPFPGKLSALPEPDLVKRILIAEDDPILRRLETDILSDEGLAITATSDGEQAWEALGHGYYDALVTDNEMPNLTGLALVERIRKAGLSLPIIIASGSFRAESVDDYPQLKIAAVIPKPFSKSNFLNAVKTILSLSDNDVAEHPYAS